MIKALCWHIVNVCHVTFWVSSALPCLPSLFLLLIQFPPIFSSPACFILLLFLLHLYPCFFNFITSAIFLFYSLSASIIMAKQYHFQYACGVYFPRPFYCHPQTLTKYSWLTPSPPSIPAYFMIILYNMKGSGNFKRRLFQSIFFHLKR